MRGAALLVLAILSCLPVNGCKKEEAAFKNIQAKLDPELTDLEHDVLWSDALRLASMKIRAKRGSVIDQIFPGGKLPGVSRYLNDRINYILSSTRDIKASIVPLHEQGAGNWQVIARNVGGRLWLERIYTAPEDFGMRIGNKIVRFESSRVGVIQIGEPYLDLPQIARLAVLVHEARHSDCTGGITRAQIKNIGQGASWAETTGCLHPHGACPRLHPYAGRVACDSRPWGAYSVEAVFAAAVHQACRNCTQKEKQTALATAAEALERVPFYQAMMKGELGPPDMSSSGLLD